LDQLARPLIVRPGALLRADLNNALVSPGRVNHPAAFADEKRQGLFDVNILTGLAGEHGLQSVPVVGRRDDHRVNVFAIKQGAEIGVAARSLAELRQALVEPPSVNLGETDQSGVGLLLEVQDMTFADQTVAEEADVYALVGSADLVPAGRGQQSRRS